MLFARRPPTRSERMVDVMLGVSRRRRRAAMFAIAGGLAVLRPRLWRGALAVCAVALLLLLRA